jgi:acyl-CoA thioesterase FadM
VAHINSFIRLPLVALRHKIRPFPRIGITEEDRVCMRVWPNDIDLNFHLNNSRFLTCMDYARMHQITVTGIFDVVMRHRWAPLVGSVYITYRRPLHVFTRFEITTRTVAWDERWFYKEQHFRFAGGLAAHAWVKGTFHDGKGTIPPQRIIDEIEEGQISPALPEGMKRWNELTRENLHAAEGKQPLTISR